MRQVAYLTDIKQLDTLPAFYKAFTTGIRYN